MRKIIALCILMGFCAGCGHVVATGTKVGTIIKVYNGGFWHRTWEMEVIKGGMNGGTGSFSTTPEWITLTTPEQVAEAQHDMDAQQEVQVAYTQTFWAPYSSNEDYKFCNSITRLKR